MGVGVVGMAEGGSVEQDGSQGRPSEFPMTVRGRTHEGTAMKDSQEDSFGSI